MERRIMIKGLLAVGATAFLQGFRTEGSEGNKRFHYVGLGSAGTTALIQCKRAGFKGSYSGITGPYVSYLTKDIQHCFFVPAQEMRRSLYYSKNFDNRITLTPEMRSVFSGNDIYLIFTGLGSCTGTGLISGVLEMLAEEEKNYVAICSMPFINEGRVRNEYALRKKAELEKIRNIFFFDHNRINEKYGNLPVRELFAMGDKMFCSVFINQALPIIDRM